MDAIRFRRKAPDDSTGAGDPQFASAKPATRLATAILLYSFGGLRREGSGESETLPPGVTESELLAACVGPDLDNITATAVLSELCTSCLYLHYDGVRYCFKKDPNATKLIEDAEQSVSREEARLAGHRNAQIWPTRSQDIPDEDPRFLVGYLPLEFASEGKAEQERQAKELLSKYGDRPRRYRNGIGLAVPEVVMLPPMETPTGVQEGPVPGTLTQPTGPAAGSPTGIGGTTEQQRRVRLTFKATRDQVFKAFPAIANLADKSDDGKVTVRVEGTSTDGYDPSWFRNAVEEPLDEVDIERLPDAAAEPE